MGTPDEIVAAEPSRQGGRCPSGRGQAEALELGARVVSGGGATGGNMCLVYLDSFKVVQV